MVTTTLIRRPALVARWVTVTDISGRRRAELRWVPDDTATERVRAA